MKKLLQNFKDFSLWEVKEENALSQIDQFVLRVYYYHHLRQISYPQKELQKLIQEDTEVLSDSSFFVVYDKKDEIVGTIKLQRWNQKTILSIQKDFKVNLEYFISGLSFKPENVFHVGRFAINQEKIKGSQVLKQNRITIMKLLMYYALAPINAGNTNIFFCECDEKLYTKLEFLGLHTRIIGSAKVYLGSKTVPIYCNQSGIKDFICKNNYLAYVS